MANQWPGGSNTFTTNHADDVGEPILAPTVNELAALGNSIPLELGTNPSGGESSVQLRFERRTESVPVDLGNVSGTVPLPWSSRINLMFMCRPTGTTTFTFSGTAEVGAWAELFVWQSGGPHSVTLPSALWPDGANGAVTAAAGARDRFGFHYLGGFEMHGFVVGNNLS